MARRSSKVHLAAAYQLLAGYLVWDLRDLLRGSVEGGAAHERVMQLIEILASASRAAEPVYPAGSSQQRTGAARGERSERLASLDSDQELLELVDVAHSGDSLAETSTWAEQARSVLSRLEESRWAEPSPDEVRFIENEVQPFLERLQRIEQIDSRRPGSRAGLAR